MQALVTAGPYKGHVVIIIKQDRPFPLLELPKDIRTRILKYLLQDETGSLTLSLKQGGNRTAYAQHYHEKHNVAILATCKQLRDEAAEIIYGHKFNFPGTQVAASFLLQTNQFQPWLKQLELETYNPSTARTLFWLLRNCPQLERIKFNHITSNESPKTAITNFFNDVGCWLCVVDKANPCKRLELIEFDDFAYHMRVKTDDGKVIVTQWEAEEKDEFQKGLRAKLDGYANSRA